MKMVCIGLLSLLFLALFNGARGGWLIEQVDSREAGGGVSIAMSSDGTPHIAWASWTWNPGTVYYSSQTFLGWNTQKVCYTHGGLSLAFSSADRPYIGFIDILPCIPSCVVPAVWFKGSDGEWHYMRGQGLLGDDVGRGGISVALDPSDNCSAAYELSQTQNPPYSLYYVRFTTGIQPPEGEHVYSGCDGWDYSLKFSSSLPWIAFRSTASSPHPPGLLFATRTGDSWNIYEVDVGSPQIGIGTSMVIDGSGHPNISYCRLSTGSAEVWWARGTWTGSSWSWIRERVDVFPTGDWPSPYGNYRTSISIDNSGTISISYCYFPPATENPGEMPGIKLATRVGANNWVNEYVINDPERGGTFNSLALEPYGVPYVAFGTESGLWCAYNSEDVPTPASSSSEATYPSSVRHLQTGLSAIDYESMDRFLTYQSDYGVYLNWLHESGAPQLTRSLRIDNGYYPSVVVHYPSDFENGYWGVAYVWQNLPWLKLHTPYGWRKIPWFEGEFDYVGPISAIMGTWGLSIGGVFQANDADGAHLVFGIARDQHYDGNLDVPEVEVIHSNPDPDVRFNPSIAVTPGDYYHITFQENGNVYYMMGTPDPENQYPHTWQGPVEVNYSPSHPPRSHPFVETYGEEIYVSYTQPPSSGAPTDVWRMWRLITWPDISQWEPYGDPSHNGNISHSSHNSDFSTIAGRPFTVWEEDQNNYDIFCYARFDDGYEETFAYDDGFDRYPHSNWYSRGLEPDYETGIDMIWTSQAYPHRYYDIEYYTRIWSEGPYLLASDSNYAPPPPIFYKVETGKPIPSPYCKKRAGYLNNSADYGDTLVYELPYLYPYKYYLLRAVLYVSGPTPDYRAMVDFEAIKDTLIACRPGIPETLDILIPQKCYKDTKVELTLRTLTNQNSVYVSHLALYQFDALNNPTKGGPMSSPSKRPSTPSLSITPNLVTDKATIKYHIPVKGKVTLAIYDASGRLVKTLLNASDLSPRTYTLSWNTRDDRGKLLPGGIYFIRLKTSNSSLTSKVIVLR